VSAASSPPHPFLFFPPEPRSKLSLVPGLSLFSLRQARVCCFFGCDADFGVGYALALKLDFPSLVYLFFYKGIYVRCACAMLCLMAGCFLTLHDLAQLYWVFFRKSDYIDYSFFFHVFDSPSEGNSGVAPSVSFSCSQAYALVFFISFCLLPSTPFF